MKWYEVIIGIAIVIIGAYIHGKVIEYKKNMFHNDSWKSNNK